MNQTQSPAKDGQVPKVTWMSNFRPPANRVTGALRPSIADAIFLALFLYICLFVGQGLLIDADTGHHIRAGEYILNTHSVPKADIFSFITPPLPWTNHGWLSEVIMALVHRKFGLTGIVIFFAR